MKLAACVAAVLLIMPWSVTWYVGEVRNTGGMILGAMKCGDTPAVDTVAVMPLGSNRFLAFRCDIYQDLARRPGPFDVTVHYVQGGR